LKEWFEEWPSLRLRLNRLKVLILGKQNSTYFQKHRITNQKVMFGIIKLQEAFLFHCAIILLIKLIVAIHVTCPANTSHSDTGSTWKKIGDPEGDNNTLMDSRGSTDNYEANVAFK
jgi:hypothetical protein